MAELEKPRLSNADRSLPAISSGELRPESLLVALGETPIKTFEFKTLGRTDVDAEGGGAAFRGREYEGYRPSIIKD